MALKGAVQPGHVPVNNFELIIAGLPPIFFTQISGLTDETESINLPDRTVASGGNSLPLEFTAMSFEHHTVERAALLLWQAEGVDPVSKTYKKAGNLIQRNIHGDIVSTRTLTGLWIKSSQTSDLDIANEGEPSMLEWTFSADSVKLI